MAEASFPMGNPASQEAPARKRSKVACTNCNRRKVRCDVGKTSIPCSNCKHDQPSSCQIVPRKKHRPRQSRNIAQTSRSTIGHGESQDYDQSQTSPTSTTTAQEDNSHNPLLTRSPFDDRISVAQLLKPSGRQSISSLNNGPTEQQESTTKNPHAPDQDEVLPDDSSLTYIGDARGPRAVVYDLCHPEAPQDAVPHPPPKPLETSWKPHEVEYLRHQGAFDVIPNDVCDDLIRCYFHHVHFFLPVVDAASFLVDYDTNGRKNTSLLLFWSMLLAAANFVDEDVLSRSGFRSRKAMKTAFYERAKALYDLDHGTDNLVLIESVILMGFWYTDAQNHTGAWYWIGIAISLSQTLGLHRKPQGSNHAQRFLDTQQPLISRIWWSCLVRDRWISLAKGRPARIHHEDCDISQPSADDIMSNLRAIPANTRKRFIPTDSAALADMWISLVRISANLGKILRIHYSVNGPRSNVEDVDASAQELRKCKPQLSFEDNTSDSVVLNAYHIELFYEATVAVLYRPYVLGASSSASSKWPKAALEHAHAAASNTNSVLERIIELNAIHLLKPMIITAIIPAMQIHLFDCKSTVALRRGLGKNKLSLCMLVLAQLRNTYWSASVISRLFERAQAMLDKSSRGGTAQLTPVASEQTRLPIKHSQNTTEYQQQQQPPNQHHELANNNMAQLPVPQSNIPIIGPAMTGSYCLNVDGLPCFHNVDQLLSPGFSVPDNMFQSLFNGFDPNLEGVYDQMNTAPNNGPVGMMYNV